MINDWLSVDLLRQFPIAIAVVWAVVKWILGPGADKLLNQDGRHLSTRWVVLATAIVIVFIPDLAEGTIPSGPWNAWFGWMVQNVLNGLVVTLAAMQWNDLVTPPKSKTNQ